MTNVATETRPAGPPAPRAAAALSSPWLRFLGRRLLRFVVSVWAVMTAAFLMIHLIPGDPVRAALGMTASPELVQARRDALGLGDPLWLQYLHYFRDLFSGNLGTSMISQLPVSQVISDRLPATLEVALLAFVVVMVIAIPLGLLMAVSTRGGRRRGLELGFTGVSIVLAAIPEFLLATGLVYLFAVKWQIFPIAGNDQGASSYVLPVISLSLGSIMVMSRIVRVETLAVLGNDFVRTARAKRLPARLIYLRHALPNALTATLTISGMMLTGLVAGTVLVEYVFNWPGLGMTITQSILQKDYPVVQAIVLVYGVAVLLVNLVVDLLLGLLDPRSTIRES